MAKKTKVLAEAKEALAKRVAIKKVPEAEMIIKLQCEIIKLNERIDRIVVAHTKCKSLKGM